MERKKAKIGFIGLGPTRGYSLMWLSCQIPEIEITALCDVYPDRIEDAEKYLQEVGRQKPRSFTDYKEFIKEADVDAAIVATPWAWHVDISVALLKAGITVGCEVGGGYSEEDCWLLVRTVEETGTPFMFLENCCFDKAELLATNLVRKGVLGKIVNASGAYCHDLREEITTGKEKRHYRLAQYTLRNCENYPTHDLGPIAKILNINRGNKMASLVSVGSLSAGLKEYVKRKDRQELMDVDFKQSDVVHTLITCAGGETIHLKLGTTLPHYYDRAFTVEGTKGFFNQSLHALYLDSDEEHVCGDSYLNTKKAVGTAEAFEEQYLPRMWKEITKEEMEQGHGGMDLFMLRTFVDCILQGKPMPIDVYDAAAWMCISYLSERSIAQGGAPQAIPDFTRGKWITRPSMDVISFDE